jgi:hypothetical protein
MNDRPTATELLRAVERFLQRDVVPALQGPGRFHARVAANVVAIVAREIETEEQHLSAEWERLGAVLGGSGERPASRAARRDEVRGRRETLVARLRAGGADRGPWREQVVAHLRQTVADKLEVARPPRQR